MQLCSSPSHSNDRISRLATTGHIRSARFSFLRGDGPNYFEWSATPLIGQWIWSTPFQLILGENHQALRCSTAFLHVVLGALLTMLLQRTGVRHAALIAAVVAFHPLMCLASVSF